MRLNFRNPRLLLTGINFKNLLKNKNKFLTTLNSNRQNTISTYFSLSLTNDLTNTKKMKSTETENLDKEKIDYFMKKEKKFEKPKIKKSNYNILFPQTYNSQYKIEKNPIKGFRESFSPLKIETFTTLNNKIRRNIGKSILNKYMNDEKSISISKKNFNSMDDNLLYNPKEETIDQILNKDKFRYDRDNFKEENLLSHFSKRNDIGTIVPNICFPEIMKDTSLMARLYKQNFNYQKNKLKDSYKKKLKEIKLPKSNNKKK
jgi:hypothetical protein